MASNRLFDLEPSSQNLFDYVSNINNKSLLINKLAQLKLGIWKYFFRGTYANYEAFDVALANAKKPIDIHTGLVAFYTSDKAGGTLFLKEILLTLYPKDNNRLEKEDIVNEIVDFFIAIAKVQMESQQAKITREAEEEKAKIAREAEEEKELQKTLEEKKQKECEERKRLMATVNITAQRSTLEGNLETTKIIQPLQHQISNNSLSKNAELASSQALIAKFFKSPIQPTSSRSGDLSKEDLEFEKTIRNGKPFANYALKKVKEHAEKVKEQKRLQQEQAAIEAKQKEETRKQKTKELIAKNIKETQENKKAGAKRQWKYLLNAKPKDEVKQTPEIEAESKHIDPFHRRPMY